MFQLIRQNTSRGTKLDDRPNVLIKHSVKKLRKPNNLHLFQLQLHCDYQCRFLRIHRRYSAL